MTLTQHGDAHCRQRGYKSEDPALIERYGTDTWHGIYRRRPRSAGGGPGSGTAGHAKGDLSR